MKHFVLGFLVAGLSSVASAIDVRATWDTPTTKEDGTPLQASQITQYELEYVNLTTLKRATKFAKGSTNGYVIPISVAGRYGFRIRAYDTGGLISQWSPQVVKDVVATTPPPTCVCP